MRDRILNSEKNRRVRQTIFDEEAPAVWSEATRLVLEKAARPQRAEPRATRARQTIFDEEAPAVWSEATRKEENLIG
jgi:hypothetical protein